MATRGRPRKQNHIVGIAPNLADLHFVPLTGTELSGMQRTVFLDRYSLKDEAGNATELFPEHMWERVAKGLASVEKTERLQRMWAEKFYHAMEGFKFVPGGRILSGAGTPYEVTFYNCFVIPSPSDSRGGIIDNLKTMIEIMSRSGGVGINLSSLRPRGARVLKVNGTSSGPVNWAELYSVATHDIIQQGGSRRGALMLMLDDWHPDLIEFITAKRDLSRINGANVSVCISDAFMEAVKNDAEWQFLYPDTTYEKYDTEWAGNIAGWREKGYPVKVFETVKAATLWNMICESAWASAEPGLHFIDRSNKRSNTHYYERLIATNPCGEQPLGAWAVCNLGAMNLAAFVREDGTFDYDELMKNTKIAVRALDNVVDANYYFFEENEKQQKGTRRTGLGTMGLGDALIKMHLRYGSEEAASTIEKMYATIRDATYEASTEIAAEKGSFPMFDKEKYLRGWFIQRLPEHIREAIALHGIRNAVILTQAPTGTTSLLAGVSSGIEPVYDFAFVRRDRTGEHTIYHPLFQAWKDTHPNEPVPGYFVSANDLTPEEHVRVQAIIQEYTDSSISKTVNAPKTHTVEDVKRLYTLAYDLGLKGVTYMRDGSRPGVLSHIEEQGKQEQAPQPLSPIIRKEPTPEEAWGIRLRKRSDVGNVYTALYHNAEGRPVEIFVTVGKSGGYVAGAAEVTGRLASLALKYGASPHEVADELIGITCGTPYGVGSKAVLSMFDAVGKSLAEFSQEKQMQLPLKTTAEEEKKGNGEARSEGNDEPRSTDVNIYAGNGNGNGNGKHPETTTAEQNLTNEPPAALQYTTAAFGACPNCGSPLIAQEGCAICINPTCGYSKCG